MSESKYSKIAVFGDLHLGLYQDSEVWHKYADEWIDYFIEECNKRLITTVFFLGDWFHYRDSISVDTLDHGTKLMEKLANAFGEVYVIVGNHDCYFKDTAEVHSLGAYKRWSNVTVIDKSKEMSIHGKNGMFVPWGGKIPQGKYDYIFGHFEIINFYENKVHKCEDGETHTYLLNKANKVFSGHFHMRQEKKYKKGDIFYVGSPFQHNFGDCDNENGFYVIDVQDNTEEFVVNPKGMFPTFHLINVSNIDEVKKKKDDIKNGYVKVIIDKEVSDKTLETLKGKLFNTFKIKDLQYDLKNNIRTLDNYDISDNIKEINIISCIVEYAKTLKLKYEDEIIKLSKEKVSKYEEN
jgi:DNA repair exonuclease SbcCD nuclease subunit